MKSNQDNDKTERILEWSVIIIGFIAVCYLLYLFLKLFMSSDVQSLLS